MMLKIQFTPLQPDLIKSWNTDHVDLAYQLCRQGGSLLLSARTLSGLGNWRSCISQPQRLLPITHCCYLCYLCHLWLFPSLLYLVCELVISSRCWKIASCDLACSKRKLEVSAYSRDLLWCQGLIHSEVIEICSDRKGHFAKSSSSKGLTYHSHCGREHET